MAVFTEKSGSGNREAVPGLSIIGAGMRVVGDISADGVVKIEGSVNGTVRAAKQVLVARGDIGLEQPRQIRKGFRRPAPFGLGLPALDAECLPEGGLLVGGDDRQGEAQHEQGRHARLPARRKREQPLRRGLGKRVSRLPRRDPRRGTLRAWIIALTEDRGEVVG